MNGQSNIMAALRIEVNRLEEIVAKVDALIVPLELPAESVHLKHWLNRREGYLEISSTLKKALSLFPPQG